MLMLWVSVLCGNYICLADKGIVGNGFIWLENGTVRALFGLLRILAESPFPSVEE